jgi:FkbM family methyltransferase
MTSPIEPTASPEITREPQLISFLRRLLYSDRVKGAALQGFWRRLYYLSLFAMNCGGASGSIETSGEKWVMHHVVGPAFTNKAAPVIFDVGANMGLYALNAHAEIPQARIHAFEPARETYEILRNKIRDAGADSLVTPHNIGFSNAKGEADLFSYAIDGDELSIHRSDELCICPQDVPSLRALCAHVCAADVLSTLQHDWPNLLVPGCRRIEEHRSNGCGL